MPRQPNHAVPAPLNEPVIRDCLFVTELVAVPFPGGVQVVGIVHVPTLGGETEERRIAFRCGMVTTTARAFHADLAKLLIGN